jgi:hypothetical protein
MNENQPPKPFDAALRAVARMSTPDPRDAREQQRDDRSTSMLGLVLFILYGCLMGLFLGWLVWG